MSYTLLGLGLLFSWALWGVAIALLVLPRRWRPGAFAFCLPIGASAQIMTVWWVGVAGGTVSSSRGWFIGLPLVLWALLLARSSLRRALRHFARSAAARVAAALVLAALLLALLPVATSKGHSGALTTFSFGSADAPDYVLGARLLFEAGPRATGGFWTQAEVHQFPEGMTLWTYWTRLNHFGPSALMAVSLAYFPVKVWQIGSVLAAALGAASVPLVLALARLGLRLRLRHAAAIAALYAFSPLWLYAAYHVALGQLAGTAAIALCFLIAWRLPELSGPRDWLRAVVTGVLGAWLLLSSYAFMGIFVAGVIAACGLGRAVVRRDPASFFQLLAFGLVVTLTLVAAFPLRMWGALESVSFFGQGSFGWAVGPMHLTTVLGLASDLALSPLASKFLIPLGAGFGAFWIHGLWVCARRADGAFAAAAIPPLLILGGAAVLVRLDPLDEQLHSYKAYKLVAVFLPVLLPALLVGFKHPGSPLREKGVSAAILLAVLFFLPRPLAQMWEAAAYTPLRAEPDLMRLEEVERDREVHGVNIVATEVWDRLWASALLAWKPQSFAEMTYVSQGAGPLRGDWTVEDDKRGMYPGRVIRIGRRLVVRRTDEPALVQLAFGPGWYADEFAHRWSGSDGRRFGLKVQARVATRADLRLDGTFRTPGTGVAAALGGHPVQVEQDERGLTLRGLALEAGENEVTLEADRDPQPPRNRRDSRALLFKLNRLTLTLANDASP